MVEFGRIEYLTRVGWVLGHAGIALQDPQRYVNTAAKPRVSAGVDRGGTIARFIPIDDSWQPGSPVLPPDVPAFHEAPQGKFTLTEIKECAACGQEHQQAWDCLL